MAYHRFHVVIVEKVLDGNVELLLLLPDDRPIRELFMLSVRAVLQVRREVSLDPLTHLIELVILLPVNLLLAIYISQVNAPLIVFVSQSVLQ